LEDPTPLSLAVARNQKRKRDEGEDQNEEGNGKKEQIYNSVDEADDELEEGEIEEEDEEQEEEWRKVEDMEVKEEDGNQGEEWIEWTPEDAGNEPQFIWNEGPLTHWGQHYFEALEKDTTLGGGKRLREPFHRNEEGFILKHHPSEGQS